MDATSRRTTVQAGGLVLAGAVAGGVLAAAVTASASSPSGPAAGPAGYGYVARPFDAAGPGDPAVGPGRPGRHLGVDLLMSGTVKSVGSKSLTITTSSGTKTYAVDAQSDIDKNGEAQLSDLKAGDAVRFGLRPGTSTIGVLHAGDEAKDVPAGRGGHGGPCPGMNGGTRPAPTPTSTT